MFLHQGYIVSGLTILLTIISGTRSGPVPIADEALEYLSKYGYLGKINRNKNVAHLMHSDTWTQAITDLQKFNGLNTTGILDENTKKLMSLPRCGLPDKSDRSQIRQKRYTIEGSKWYTKHLTYKIVNYPANLRKEDVDNVIAQAFEVWRKHTDLTFTRTDSDEAILKISFVRGNHGDDYPFEGQNGNLAHAFFPSSGGHIHFDADENWTINAGYGIDLFRVAVHEFGHTLGLDHSDVPSSVMAPVYSDKINYRELHPDDIAGIQQLYGKNSSPATNSFYSNGFYYGR